jgi:hypothetical protein
MKNYKKGLLSLFTLTICISLFIGCSRDAEELEEAPFPDTPEVFIDGFSGDMAYEAFGESKITAFEVDLSVKYKGETSMRFDVPNTGDPAGGFAAGLFKVDNSRTNQVLNARDLSSYNVLTFWGRASEAASIDELGFGFTFDNEKYKAHIKDTPFSTTWTKYFVPIPDPSKLTKEVGLFYFVDGPEDGEGYSFWIDELKYENLGTIGYETASILNGEDREETASTGSKITIGGLAMSANLPNGVDQEVIPAPAYFDFNVADNSVASVSELGVVEVKGEGTTTITGSIGNLVATGSLKVISTGAFIHAPTPTRDPANVLSLFSNAYTNVPVEYYNGFWAPFQTTLSADFTIDGDDVLSYTDFNFVGTQFTIPTIDGSEMTHLHLDLWLPNEVDPAAQFAVEIVDIGSDGTFDAPNYSTEVVYTSPDPLVSQSWIGLDIPLSGLTSKTNLAQVIYKNLDSPLSNFYVDNVYFYSGDAPDPVTLPIDFENGENLTGAFDNGANGEPVTNPDQSGINTSSTVYQFNKVEGSAWYSGVFNIFTPNIDPALGNVFKFKIWSPKENINVRFQLEKEGNQGPIPTYNLDRMLTTANTWVEMEFDFSSTPINLADGYDKIVIFPDFDESNQVPVSPAAIYYLDDISQAMSSGGDNTPPVITLNGEATINLNVGDMFTDPGATATDNVDGDISGNIMVGGDMVDTNSPGTYVITYNVSDAAGNAAAEVTRTVIVSDSGMALFPIDFEDGSSLTGAFDGGANGANADNPDQSGINTSLKVYQFNKVEGSAWYSGAFNIFSQDIDPSQGNNFKLKIWSPKANINVRFQLEKEGNQGPIPTYSIDRMVTTANTWVELEYDFSDTPINLADGYDKIVIFPDFDDSNQVPVSPEAIYYIDDIDQDFGGGGDMVAPVITLIGESTINLNVGDMFTDPGAMAMDNVDGDISGNIMVGGDMVDTNTPGTYVITYNVSDAAGNAAAEVTRTVIVSDSGMGLFPLDFEDGSSLTGAFDGGANGANADNPDQSGINTSSKVYQFNKVEGSAWYSGAFNIFSQDIDPSKGNNFKLKIWSPKANINVRFQLEKEGNQGPIPTYSIDRMVTTADTWVELEYDFSDTPINLADGYDKIVIFPDFDDSNQVPVSPAAIYYIDDIDQDFGGGGDMVAPVITLIGASTINLNVGDMFTDPGAMAMDNVDGDISGNIVVGGDMVDVNTVGTYVITYNVIDAAGNAAAEVTRTVIVSDPNMGLFPIDFEDGSSLTGAFDGGANGANADNPDQSGINTSSKVYQFNKVQGSAWYSGMFNIFPMDIDPAGGTTFKFKIWSPKANINVRFQLEKEGNQGPIVTYLVDQTLTEANTWVEMSFDFSTTPINLADGYDKIVIFPDFDDSNQVPVATEAIYYIDDITQQ